MTLSQWFFFAILPVGLGLIAVTYGEWQISDNSLWGAFVPKALLVLFLLLLVLSWAVHARADDHMIKGHCPEVNGVINCTIDNPSRPTIPTPTPVPLPPATKDIPYAQPVPVEPRMNQAPPHTCPGYGCEDWPSHVPPQPRSQIILNNHFIAVQVPGFHLFIRLH